MGRGIEYEGKKKEIEYVGFCCLSEESVGCVLVCAVWIENGARTDYKQIILREIHNIF